MIKNINKRLNRLENKSNVNRTVVPVKKKNEKQEITPKKENKNEKKNNKNNNTEDMNNMDLNKANDIVNSINNEKSVKRIKSEKGLIERIENDKVVLTEDNKMLLKD